MLPQVGNEIGHARSSRLLKAIDLSVNIPVFTATDNVVHKARRGTAEWNDGTLDISPDGLHNYYYIPPVDGRVSFCIFPSEGLEKDCYVISDQFGGCQYHTLYNENEKMFAFLHVFRERGNVVQYQMADGWRRLSIQHSSPLSRRKGTAGIGVWAISHIRRDETNPVANSCFMHLDNTARVTEIHDGAMAE